MLFSCHSVKCHIVQVTYLYSLRFGSIKALHPCLAFYLDFFEELSPWHFADQVLWSQLNWLKKKPYVDSPHALKDFSPGYPYVKIFTTAIKPKSKADF
jgi:hypothetical protein